jgi:hypothetical protein
MHSSWAFIEMATNLAFAVNAALATDGIPQLFPFPSFFSLLKAIANLTEFSANIWHHDFRMDLWTGL